MRSAVHCLLFLFLGLTSLKAQMPFQRNHQLFSGKEDYSVNHILQDSAGIIWFGTDRGLFKFDGITYEHFTESDGLAENRISALCDIGKGSMWIGHMNGSITTYDGMNFSVFDPEEGMGTVEITDITVTPDGTIWFSTRGEGIYRYDGRHMANFSSDDGLSDNYVYDIEADPDGALWVATDYGFTRFLGDEFTVVSMKDGLPDNIVRSLYLEEGRLYLGTEEKGLSLYDTSTGRLINFGGWNYGPVTGIVKGVEGRIWISTEGEGVIKALISNDTLATYQQINEEQGLISNQAYTIVKDFEEDIWIGCQQGVIQVLPPVFEFMDASRNPFENVFSLLVDSGGHLWVSSEKGLYMGYMDVSGKMVWINVSRKLHLEQVNFISLYEDHQNRIWAGSYGYGLYIIDPVRMKYQELNTSNGLSDNNVINISGTDDCVWISTLGGGVNCYEIPSSELKHIDHPQIGESYVYNVHPSGDGKIWITGLLDFPYYILGDSVYHVRDTSIVFPSLYGVATDASGNAWFNTLNEGLIEVSGDSVRTLGPEEGIALQEIQSIVFDKYGNLVIYANSAMQIYHPETGNSIILDENSGLGFRYPLLNSVFVDRQDQIWFGTENGIIKYNPDYLYITNQQPRLYLSTMDLFDAPINRNRKKYGHRSNNFTFGYTGLWFKNPEMLSFRYQLEGYDLGWNYYERNRDIPYPRLQPGEYTFRVEVSLDGKSWLAPRAGIYSFTISPPFWKRWWFIISVVVIVVAGVLLYIRMRLSNLEKAKKELEREVRKRTEQIRNKNIALEMQKEEIEAQRDLAEEQRDQIEHQKEEIQSSIRYAYRIQSAALPPHNLLDDLLKDYFVFSRPRDIVSGDFYWVARKEANLFFCVADCTGHGVPGAFMSMLGITALNDIVKSVDKCTASGILDLLTNRIRESLHQSDMKKEATTADGMDISLCIYDLNKGTLQFAGANNHLYLVREGEVLITRADKQDIGSRYFDPKPFTNHQVEVKKDDCIYLFSDGFPDQFGGPAFKKYKYNKFRELLKKIHTKPMREQEKMLGEEFDNWVGTHQQIDDVIVLGVRVDSQQES